MPFKKYFNAAFLKHEHFSLPIVTLQTTHYNVYIVTIYSVDASQIMLQNCMYLSMIAM